MHRAIQDVKWIEELIGRRLSLHADAVIAVSNSGFTTGAIKKAAAHGIILRDFRTLTSEEVRAWGTSTRISLTFFQYQNLKISMLVAEGAEPIVADKVIDKLKESQMLYYLLQKTSDELDRKGVSQVPRTFEMQASLAELPIGDGAIEGVILSGSVTRIVQELAMASVVAYDAPDVEVYGRQAFIEKVPIGDFEITHSLGDMCISVDLGAIVCPPNSMFLYFGTKFARDGNIKKLEILRPPPFRISINDVKFFMGVRRKN